MRADSKGGRTSRLMCFQQCMALIKQRAPGCVTRLLQLCDGYSP
jgi:hypothetical protein